MIDEGMDDVVEMETGGETDNGSGAVIRKKPWYPRWWLAFLLYGVYATRHFSQPVANALYPMSKGGEEEEFTTGTSRRDLRETSKMTPRRTVSLPSLKRR